MKVPGPDHPISIEQSANRVQIIFNGRTVAESDRALTLYEAGHPPRLYVPRKDADMSLFERSARTSHCPYKGDAAYYSVRVGDQIAENAVWTYEDPYPAVGEIKDHLCFYPERVEVFEEPPPPSAA